MLSTVSHESSDIILTCTWAVGHYFNLSITKQCLTTLTAFTIPDITWAVEHSFNLYVHEPSDILVICTWVLHGPGWLYVLGITLRGDLPLWTLRARAMDLDQGPNLRRGLRARSLRATEPRARETTRGRKRKKCRRAKKNTFIHSNIRFLFGMCATWNPGGDANWWKETRRQHSSSHSLLCMLEET